MEALKKHWLTILFFILFMVTFIAHSSSIVQHNNEVAGLLQNYSELLSETEVVRNKNTTLLGAISSLETENDDLKAVIADLNARPETIRYITKVETVVKPGTPVVVTPDLPDEYLFQLGEHLVVARFSKQDEEFRFETYDLRFKNIVVISETKTAASLQLQTSYDDSQWEEVPVDVEVAEIRKTPLLEPHLGIGVTASTSTSPIVGSIFVSVIHPNEDLDVLSGRIGFNNELVRFGIDAVGYNIGKPLPVLTDTWLYAGGSLDTHGNPTIDLTIGSKF